MPKLPNILGFQLVWLSLVASPALDQQIPALLLAALWMLLHFRYSAHRRADLQLLLTALALGPLCDTLLLHLQLVDYHGLQPLSGLPPLWVYALWAHFSLLLNHGMNLLRRQPVLVGIIVLLSAPVAYCAGARLGAAVLAQPLWQPLLVIMLCWSLVVPLLLRLSVDSRPPPQAVPAP